ncbi:SWI/SNF chromatin-remodeling complex subunit [Pseudogymnoascus australis]
MAPEQHQASSSVAPPNSTTATTAATESAIDLPHRRKGPPRPAVAEKYAARDLLHSAALIKVQQNEKETFNRKLGEVQDYTDIRTQYRKWFPPSRLYGEGYNGFGNGHTDEPVPSVLYPVSKIRAGHKRTPMLRVKRKDLNQQAEQVEELIPIRLDVDWEKIKLRDTFTWNLHDRVVPMKLFAEQLVEDFGVEGPAAEHVLDMVMRQIYDQLADFCPPVYIEEDALDPELPYLAYKNDEMRILIKLNITIGQHTLVDQFEWDVNNPLNSPEEFALSMSRELSLSGEFTTAIAHCIREQSQLFTKSLYIVGYPFDGRPVEDSDLVAAFLPTPLPSAFRPHQQAREYAPFLYEMKESDLEKNEVIFSREQRRQKRSVNRRGGPTLPDLKDRQRTVRTLTVSSVLPGAAETIEESRIFKRVGGLTGRGKRGAAGPSGGLDGISESEDSDDSVPESPAPNQLQGTLRTRNMRGAATAAQQRMANQGRSETPEAILHHHETRTSARRFGGRDARDESPDGPVSFVIKLKIGKEKLQKYLRDRKAASKPLSQHSRSQSNVSGLGTPARGSMGPPSTPGLQNQQLGAQTTTPGPVMNPQMGRVDAPPPPPQGQSLPAPPPPPAWLIAGLQGLQQTYTQDRFEGMMRYFVVDATTEMPVPQAEAENSSNVKYMWFPRIRCSDCPGKLYTPGPGTTVEGFEVHLRNRQHRERVDARTGE